MKCLQLLFLFLCCCSSILAVTSGIKVDGYSCVTAYWDTITCVLNITGTPVGQSNTNYSLKFIDDDDGNVRSCPLVVMNHSYSCACKVVDDPECLSSLVTYDIKLCHESVCHPVTTDFDPSDHVKLTPPHPPEIQETPETVNISWESGYEGHRFLSTVLVYEILLQTSQGTETKLSSQNTSLLIPRSDLQPHATYYIKVRSEPNHREYQGTWSNWSPSTCWKNEAGEEEEDEDEDNTFVILIKSLGPVCVAVGVMLFVLFSPTVRMKIKTLSHTPTPAPFFQPLFQQHGGNLQEWLSPQGKFVLTYKTEEILKTDTVIVVPKPVTKYPEENQGFLNPTVQLALAQCQTAYVGLPGIHEASTPLTMVCPGETSYTQLPFPVWDVGIKEVEVVSAPPKDVFNISSVDSGCSFEDLTQSPDYSLPNSPVDDSQPPCFCADYCILNKTAGGFAPVLAYKGSSVNVPSDSLQEE